MVTWKPGKLWMLAAAAVLAFVLVFWNVNQSSYQGRSTAAWFRHYCLHEHSQREREESVRALKALGDEAVLYLLDRAFNVRTNWVAKLASQWQWKKDPQSVAMTAHDALRQVRPAYTTLAPWITDKLSQSNAFARNEVLWVLGTSGDGADQAIPYLVAGMNDSNQLARSLAKQSLKFLGAAARPAVPDLIAALDDQTGRPSVIEALGNCGSSAKAAIPHLEPFLGDANTWVRLVTAAALCKIDPSQVSPREMLLEAAQSDTLKVQEDALACLHQLPDMMESRPILMRILGEGQNGPASRALHALQFAGVDKGEITAALLKRMDTNDPAIRFTAASWLLNIDGTEKQATKVLLEYAQPGTAWRTLAIQRLGEVGSTSALPVLRSYLKDPERHIRKAAAEALEQIEGKR